MPQSFPVTISQRKQPTPLSGAPLSHGTVIYYDGATGADTCWIGTRADVKQGNGVPLRPYGSVRWTKDRLAFGIMDDGSTDTPTLYCSEDVDQIVDPLGIAIATAEESLLRGVPNVLVDTTIANETIVAGQTKLYDISPYASVSFYSASNRMELLQYGNGPVTDSYRVSYGTKPVRLAVVAETLSVHNTGGTNSLVIIEGSNRVSDRRFDGRQLDTLGDMWSQASQALGAGTLYHLVKLQVGAFPTFLVGASHATFHISDPAVTGQFQLSLESNGALALCDSAEMFTGAGGEAWKTMKGISLPAAAYAVNFKCVAAGTAALDVSIFEDQY